jgi:hypothetical protein
MEEIFNEKNIYYLISILGVLLSVLFFFIIWFISNILFKIIFLFIGGSGTYSLISAFFIKYSFACLASYFCFFPSTRLIRNFNPYFVFSGMIGFFIVFYMFTVYGAINAELFKTNLLSFILILLYLPFYIVPSYKAYLKIKDGTYLVPKKKLLSINNY